MFFNNFGLLLIKEIFCSVFDMKILFFRDCIRGLGVEKLKRAYDVLDNIENDEVEVIIDLCNSDLMIYFEDY